MRKEKWRAVTDPWWAEGHYEVSSFGRVRRLTSSKGTFAGRFCVLRPDGCGYLRTSLSVAPNGTICKAVATLVARAFIGPRPEGKEVHHKDNVRTNNRPENLEYVSHQRNVFIARVNGAGYARFGATNGRSKLSPEKATRIRERYKPGLVSYKELALEYGVSIPAIAAVVHGTAWSESQF